MIKNPKIPDGWRRLKPNEVRSYGDLFYGDNFWFDTGLVGQLAGDVLFFIRPLHENAPNPNGGRFHLTIKKNLSTSEKVKKYLKQIHGK